MAPTLCIIDQNLRDFRGHHFSWDHAVAEAGRRAGFAPLVLGHKALEAETARQAGAVAAYTDDIWAVRPGGGPLLRRRDEVMRNRRFAEETLAALPPTGLPKGSILLAHMLTRRQLLGLAMVVEKQPAHVTTFALLRYQPEFYDDGLSARAFARMRRAVANGAKLRLATDSARLSRRIARLAGLPVETLPIPHTPAGLAEPEPAGDRPMRLVTLGNARDEKGILDIIGAIALLRAEPEGLAGLSFLLQANDAAPDVADAIDEFSLRLPPEVTLLRQSLSPAAYDTLLARSDLVLLPYWRDIYEARTSGVLLEALGAGRPVICTAATWMSDELAQHGAGVLVPDRDPAALAAAIRLARREWGRLREGAIAGRHACLARHGGDAFLRCLLAPAPVAPAPVPPQRVQVFYPWPDFLDRRAGASLRSNLMVDVVAAHVEEVRVTQAGRGGPRRRGNVAVAAVPERRLVTIGKTLAWRMMRILARPLTGAAQWGEELFPWLHLERLLDPLFQREIRRLLASSDAVLLEYGFWAGPVQRISREMGLPCVLTAHDVIEDRVTGSRLLHALTAWLERRALRGAQRVVAVAPGDAARFAALGCTPVLVPNPVDLDASAMALPAPPREVLRRLGVDLPPGDFLLFVGSRHPPNVTAMARLKEIGAALHARHGEAAPLMVVAGGVSGAEKAPGFQALGRIHAAGLAALYQDAMGVAIPLPEGTGSSLKTLEAMAAGMPVLGTGVAFRGLDVTNGRQAMIEDDLARWPEAVMALAGDPALRGRLAAGGRALAERYDHRRIMATYLELLGIPADAKPVPRLPALAGGSLPAA